MKRTYKMLLINPFIQKHDFGYGDTEGWAMPPLSLGYIAAYTPDRYEIKIIDEYVKPVSEDDEADIVGITTCTSTANRAYELSQFFRKKGGKVILGGMHPSMLPEEAMNFSDSVFIGEAESLWSQVILDFENNELKKRYDSPRLPMDNLRIPRRDLYPKTYKMDMIQTARGCPFRCDFCSVASFFGNEYRQRPVNEVLDELESIPSKVVYIADDNFYGAGAKARERAAELLQGVVDRKIKKILAVQVTVNFSESEEVLKLARRAGITGVYIGFESPSKENLKTVNKQFNVKNLDETRHMKHVVRKIQKHGIMVVGAFIYGLQYDTYQSAADIVRFTRSSGIDAMDLALLTPYPGTKVFEEMQDNGALLYSNFPDDWKYFDCNHVVIKPKNLTMKEYVHGYELIIRKQLNGIQRVISFVLSLIRTKNIVASLFAYSINVATYKAQRFNKKIVDNQ